ncbi:MAG: LysR family transcriptional regulator [Candidatus Thiodiazotropha endolucinida]
MYKHLQSIAAFVAVAETSAFNRAAQKLGVKPSVVSHHVSRLEEHLGTTLVYRTTRKVTLTEHGRVLFEAAYKSMDATSRALDQIMDAQEEAIGALNVTLPVFVPEPEVEKAILNFMQRHPYVSISLNYSDAVADILDNQYDMSIRIGDPPDSSFIARKLSTVTHILVASPDFILRYGTPQKPDQLSELPYIAMEGLGDTLQLIHGDQRVEVHLSTCQLATNNIYGAHVAAVSGLGMVSLPLALCESSLAQGKLIRILPKWKQPSWPLIAIWPDNSRRKTLTKRLVDHISATMEPAS